MLTGRGLCRQSIRAWGRPLNMQCCIWRWIKFPHLFVVQLYSYASSISWVVVGPLAKGDSLVGATWCVVHPIRHAFPTHTLPRVLTPTTSCTPQWPRYAFLSKFLVPKSERWSPWNRNHFFLFFSILGEINYMRNPSKSWNIRRIDKKRLNDFFTIHCLAEIERFPHKPKVRIVLQKAKVLIVCHCLSFAFFFFFLLF